MNKTLFTFLPFFLLALSDSHVNAMHRSIQNRTALRVGTTTFTKPLFLQQPQFQYHKMRSLALYFPIFYSTNTPRVSSAILSQSNCSCSSYHRLCLANWSNKQIEHICERHNTQQLADIVSKSCPNALNESRFTSNNFVTYLVHQACSENAPALNYAQLIKAALARGCCPNNNNNNNTPLHRLATATTKKQSILEMGHILIEHNANINATNKEHETPLHLALRLHFYLAHLSNNLLFIRKLINAGALVGIQEDICSFTPLHIAVSPTLGLDNIAIYMLNHATDAEQAINTFDGYGETPLLRAVRTSKPRIRLIKLLLELKADPYVCNVFNNSAVHLATGNEKNLEYLLPLFSVIAINKKNNSQQTPLKYARDHIFYNKKSIELLLKYGAQNDMQETMEQKEQDYNGADILDDKT